MATLTFDLSDLIAGDYDPRRTKIWIEANSEAIVDATSVRLGDAKVTLDANGTGAFTNLIETDAPGILPATGRLYRVWVDYAPQSGGVRKKWTSGWFELTADADLSDLAEVDVTAASSALLETIAGYASSALAGATAAAAGAQSAAASVDLIEVISGLTGEAGAVRYIFDNDKTLLPDATAASNLSYIAGRGAFIGLRRFLDGGAGHTTIQVLGDSTAGLSGNWVRRLADWCVANAPDLRVRYRGVDSSGVYMTPELLQEGTVGTHHVTFSDSDYSYAYAVNAADFTEDLDIQVKMYPTTWPPASTGTLAARMDPSPNRGWAFYVMPTGNLQFQWSLDGTNLTSVDSPSLTIGTTDYTWVRVLANRTGSDVTISFYTGFDGTTWTPVGVPFTNVGWGPIHQPAGVKTSFGAWGLSGVGSSRFSGHISEAWVRDGSGGPTLTETQATDWAVANGAVLDPGWALDVVNGGWPSHTLSDLITYGAALTPQMGAALTILCSGHNDSTWLGAYYASLLDAWRDIVLARSPHTALAITAQNPRVPPAPFIEPHAARMATMAGWANRNGAGYLDVYSLFKDDPRFDGTATGALYNSDHGGVHPSGDGWQLWTDLVTTAIRVGA